MVKCKVEIFPRAWEDLISIEDFYYLQFGVESAKKVIDFILNSIETFEDFLDIDVLTPDKRLNELGYRIYVISQIYVAIIKRVDDIIYIYRIINTKRGYSKLFLK